MARGFKSGGRVAGTLNKRTVAVAERLAQWGCDPFRGMFEIARDTTVPMDVRLRAYAELAQYVAPKRRAAEPAGNGATTVIQIGIRSGQRAIEPEVVDANLIE